MELNCDYRKRIIYKTMAYESRGWFKNLILNIKKRLLQKTHDIEYLVQICAQFNSAFGIINTGNLTDYAVDLRYPGDIYEINDMELEESFKIVFDIKQIVLSEVIF